MYIILYIILLYAYVAEQYLRNLKNFKHRRRPLARHLQV